MARKSPFVQSISVFAGVDLRCAEGANAGDSLSFATDMVLDDRYFLRKDAPMRPLTLQVNGDGTYCVAAASAIGTPGAALHLDCVLTLMPPDGNTSDVVVLVETAADGTVAQTFALPLAALAPRVPLAVVGIDPNAAEEKLAGMACARFTRGTRITLATGAQCPIEKLSPGDIVLTRDNGPQPLRWIGMSTLRATGDFAPIRIRAGALNNANDLVVSPEHRLFIYQRTDRLGAGHSDLLVRARHLVNGNSVTVEAGGFVDYFQLLFDAHQIIYAEGIAAESLLIDDRTRPVVPPEVAARIAAAGHRRNALKGLDVSEDLLRGADAAEILRRASAR